MSSVLDDLKKLETSIVKRYQELQPALAEVEELRRVAERLGIDLDRQSVQPPARRARPAAASPRGAAKASRTRGRRSKRRDQVLKLVTERPGITVPELGKELKVDPTGLYRVVKQLQTDGSIVKKDQQLHPAGE